MPLWALAATCVALVARCAPEPQPNKPEPAPKVQGLPVPYIAINEPTADKRFHVFHGDQALTIEKPELQLGPLLAKFAKHKDEKAGYAGWHDSYSENVLSLHVAANAPSGDVWAILCAAAEAGIYKLAVGTPELIGEPLAGPTSPDFENLPTGYMKVELPKDEGLSSAPRVPKERITAYINWDPAHQAASAVVAIDARGRKPVDDTFTVVSDVIPTKGDSKQVQEERKSRRETWIDNVCKAIEGYVAKAGGYIGRLEIASTGASKDDGTPPWVFVDLTWQALSKANANRVSAGKEELAIVLPPQMQVPEPPPPELPPERGVEFPRDEPEREGPTEDERIVPDGDD